MRSNNVKNNNTYEFLVHKFVLIEPVKSNNCCYIHKSTKFMNQKGVENITEYLLLFKLVFRKYFSFKYMF